VGRARPPILTVVDSDGTTPNGSSIDEIVREGAKRMLAAAWRPRSTRTSRSSPISATNTAVPDIDELALGGLKFNAVLA
jgi:hypothetical protein